MVLAFGHPTLRMKWEKVSEEGPLACLDYAHAPPCIISMDMGLDTQH